MLMSRGFLLLCVIAVGWEQTTRAADARLRAGAARKSIVPPFTTQMGGFTDRRRARAAGPGANQEDHRNSRFPYSDLLYPQPFGAFVLSENSNGTG